MSVTSFYPEHKEQPWLTTLGRDAKAGDEHTLSVGFCIGGGEFTTYRLPEPKGANKYGEPLFDLTDADVRLPHGEFMRNREVYALLQAEPFPPREITLKGQLYVRDGFGNYRMPRAA